VTSSLVAFGFFAAATHRLAPVLATVLPALIILGIFTPRTDSSWRAGHHYRSDIALKTRRCKPATLHGGDREIEPCRQDDVEDVAAPEKAVAAQALDPRTGGIGSGRIRQQQSVTSADRTDPISLCRLRLPRLTGSRRVRVYKSVYRCQPA